MKQSVFIPLIILALLPDREYSLEGPASNPNRPPEITIEQAVAFACDKNDGIRADSFAVVVQSARVAQARLPENPEVSLESEDLRISNHGPLNGTSWFFQVEQSFHPFIRWKRANSAQAELNIVQAVFQKRKRDFIAEIKSRFMEALSWQHVLALDDSLALLTEKTHKASVEQAGEGKVSLSDTLKTFAELALTRVQRERDERNLLNAYQELAALWGSDQINFRCQGPESTTLSGPPDSHAVLTDSAAFPEEQIGKSELDGKRALLSLEKAQRIPSFKATAGLGMVRGFDETSPRAGLSLSIPLLNWNQGAVRAARASVTQAEYTRSSRRAQTRKDAANALRSASQLYHEVVLIMTAVLPSLQESLQASYAAYLSGKTGVYSLLDAQRRYFEASRGYLEAAGQYQVALIELERITGAAAPLNNNFKKE
jgi:cobalt-zinc-cadmium efflux system outer membrane protein